ncbi:MAG: CapA family protein [Oscillospiraceae bacterium]|nr:CapA family protein [Oscillospiraceae bacterium]
MSERLSTFVKNLIITLMVLACSIIGASIHHPLSTEQGFSTQIDDTYPSDESITSHDPIETDSQLDDEIDLFVDTDKDNEFVDELEDVWEPAPEFFIISMMGDCTFASEYNARDRIQSFENIVGDDFAYPFNLVKHLYEDSDFTIVNLECVLTEHDIQSDSAFHFRADPKYVNVLLEGNIDFVALGNNHTFDYGQKGYDDTMQILSDNGISYAPNGQWSLFTTEKELLIGVYSRNFPNDSEVVRAVQEMKAAGAELIIMALHWGEEGSYRASSWQKTIGQAAIDAGAHIIMGTHPHTLQEMEEYNGGYIYYSLGNWSFGGHTNPRDKDSIIAKVTVMRDLDGSISIVSVNNIPCSVSGSESINDYRPVPYEFAAIEFERTRSKLDGSFNGPDLIVTYDLLAPEDTIDPELET